MKVHWNSKEYPFERKRNLITTISEENNWSLMDVKSLIINVISLMRFTKKKEQKKKKKESRCLHVQGNVVSKQMLWSMPNSQISSNIWYLFF